MTLESRRSSLEETQPQLSDVLPRRDSQRSNASSKKGESKEGAQGDEDKEEEETNDGNTPHEDVIADVDRTQLAHLVASAVPMFQDPPPQSQP